MNMKTAAPDSALLLPDDTQNPDANDSTMTIAQKKLAIEGALTPYLTDDNLMQALRIWEENTPCSRPSRCSASSTSSATAPR